MNFISYRSAYSLFPQSTFLDKFGVLFAGNLPQHHIDKYTALGWQMQPSLSHDNYSDAPQELKSVVRYVGDKYTWTIDLDDWYVVKRAHYLSSFLTSMKRRITRRSRTLQFMGNHVVLPRVRVHHAPAPASVIPRASSLDPQSYIRDQRRVEVLHGSPRYPRSKLQGVRCACVFFVRRSRFSSQDDYDFIMAAVKSAGDHLFERSPPCLTDTLCLISYNSSFRGKRQPVVMSLDERLQEDMVSAVRFRCSYALCRSHFAQDYEHQQGGILPLPSDRGATDGNSSPSSSRNIEAPSVAEEPQGAASPISDTYSISTAQTDTTDGVPETHAVRIASLPLHSSSLIAHQIPVYCGSPSSEESEVPDEDEPPRKRARTDEPGWYRD